MVYTNHLYPFMVKFGMVYYCFPHILLDITTQKNCSSTDRAAFLAPQQQRHHPGDSLLPRKAAANVTIEGVRWNPTFTPKLVLSWWCYAQNEAKYGHIPAVFNKWNCTIDRTIGLAV